MAWRQLTSTWLDAGQIIRCGATQCPACGKVAQPAIPGCGWLEPAELLHACTSLIRGERGREWSLDINPIMTGKTWRELLVQQQLHSGGVHRRRSRSAA